MDLIIPNIEALAHLHFGLKPEAMGGGAYHELKLVAIHYNLAETENSLCS